MSTTTVLIVEDEFIIAEDVSDTLIELGYVVVGSARDYNEAIDILNTKNVNIVLVDINLNDEKDGIDLGGKIRESYNLPFIFVTSHADKATVERAKHLKPNGYLVKPFNKQDLFTSIEIALANFSGTNTNSIEKNTIDFVYIKDSNAFIKLFFSDILFVKSDGNYVSIKTKNKAYLIRKTLKEFSAELPSESFFQIHKSYIINTSYIDSVNSTNVIINSNELPIGREFKEDFMQKLHLG